jgi:DNA-binding NarL/FixJ family response regulator
MQPNLNYKIQGYLDFVSTEVGFVTPVFSIDDLPYIMECLEDNKIDFIPLPDHYNDAVIPAPHETNYEIGREDVCCFAFKYFDRLYFGSGNQLAKTLIELLRSEPFPIAARVSARNFVNKYVRHDVDKISVMIVDDHRLLRETWVYLINADKKFTTVAEASDGQMAIDLVKKIQPNIVLMDINMAPVSGLEATQRIKIVSPTSKIIGISMHSQPAYARKMLQLGAGGYVTKNSGRDELFYAMNNIYMGNRYVCDEITHALVSELQIDKEEPKTLTQREIDIINFIKQGLASKQIAQRLTVSLRTVEIHRFNICKKLKLKNSAQLVNYINAREFL